MKIDVKKCRNCKTDVNKIFDYIDIEAFASVPTKLTGQLDSTAIAVYRV
jgi:hypothetical protein